MTVKMGENDRQMVFKWEKMTVFVGISIDTISQ